MAKRYPIRVFYVIGAYDSCALVRVDEEHDETHPGPFSLEVEAIGSNHAEEHMGVPGDMDGLCVWEGNIVYSSFTGMESMHSEIDIDYEGKWRRLLSLEQLEEMFQQELEK